MMLACVKLTKSDQDIHHLTASFDIIFSTLIQVEKGLI